MPSVLPSDAVSFIDRLFPWADDNKNEQYNPPALTKGHLGSVATLLALVERVPEELLIMPGEEYHELLVGVSALKAALQSWQSGADIPLAQVPGFGHVVTLVRRALAICPDNFPATGTEPLMFIDDVDLREELRLDFSMTNRAFANSEWKAATVLAGSIVEALLL
jgi:hypothetical protein